MERAGEGKQLSLLSPPSLKAEMQLPLLVCDTSKSNIGHTFLARRLRTDINKIHTAEHNLNEDPREEAQLTLPVASKKSEESMEKVLTTG